MQSENMNKSSSDDDVFEFFKQCKVSDYRIDELKDKIQRLEGRQTLNVLLVGATGAGKSSTINALMGGEHATVGRGVDPQTTTMRPYKINAYLRFWDSPGLGDSKENDMTYRRAITNILNDVYPVDNVEFALIDLVLVVVEGAHRDLGTIYSLLNEVILPNISTEKVMVVINQADLAMKGRYWYSSELFQQPLPKLQVFLEQQSLSVQKRLREACDIEIDKPVCYAAEHGYNLEALLDALFNHIPSFREPIFHFDFDNYDSEMNELVKIHDRFLFVKVKRNKN